MAYKHDDKSSGQLVRSADWNLMGHAIEDLDTNKVNRAGDSIQGDLSVSGKLSSNVGQFASTLSSGGDLQVSANASVGGNVSLNGNLSVGPFVVQPNGGQPILNSPAGRLHISCGENLYLLPKTAAIVGKEWGGTGNLIVEGQFYAADSDIYFTNPSHNHSGIGNTAGYAAIENDGGTYQALMIMGRAGTAHGRCVKLWDYLEVNGDMRVTGRLATFGQDPKPRTAGWGGGFHTFDIEAEGTVWSRAGYQQGNRDLAENYESDLPLEQGDVVRMDPEQNRIVPCEGPNDELLMGVISSAPGLLLNANSPFDPAPPDKKLFPIALSGCIPCKVTDENGPICRGDLLTSSSTPGHAMKASPIDVNGHKFYRPGTIIGKALDPLNDARGMIEVFVSLR